jgi:hypothetical protein
MPDIDPFIKNSIYPNAADVFRSKTEPLAIVKNDCLFVLDTNSLLIPYYASSHDLEQITNIYSSLIERRRLYVPGQVAREFVSNRPERIKELFQQITRRVNIIQEFDTSKYPLLSNIPQYKALTKFEEAYNAAIRKYKTQYKELIENMLAGIKDWGWSDPVSELYSSLFTKEVVHDFEVIDKEEFKNELERRYLHRIPPGYKDKAKADEGFGDLLIWFTILDLARIYQKNIVFVSGEEKADWVIKSEGQILTARFELVAEFNSIAPNYSFHIIKLSQFLELVSGSTKLITEIKQIEEKFADRELQVLKLSFDSTDRRTWFDHFNSPEYSSIERILRQLDVIKKTVREFLSSKRPELLQSTGNNFIDDLTSLHRHGVLRYNVYKRIVAFYAVYENPITANENHASNVVELQELKIQIFESLAIASEK